MWSNSSAFICESLGGKTARIVGDLADRAAERFFIGDKRGNIRITLNVASDSAFTTNYALVEEG